MSENNPSFYFGDFSGIFKMQYCETEAEAENMCFGKHDRCHWTGAGIYYMEQYNYHCSSDTSYQIYRMPDADVLDMLVFCDAIKRKFTEKQLLEKGWIEPDAEPNS